MKIAVIGAGGVGGYFGARLAASGCEVTFAIGQFVFVVLLTGFCAFDLKRRIGDLPIGLQ